MTRKILTIGWGVFMIAVIVFSGFGEGAHPKAAVFMVTNTNDAGVNSLRWAIQSANATLGQDNIIFNIPGVGLKTISPLSQLPALLDPSGVIINGLTQPGAAPGLNPPSTTVLMIEINGLMAGIAHGLLVQSMNNQIIGLIINNFQQDGIRIEALPYEYASNNLVYCNFIGTDNTGKLDKGNGTNQAGLWAGVTIAQQPLGSSSRDTVRQNLISGNYAEGVAIIGPQVPGDVWDNHVLGNYIGTDITGTADLGNDHDGVTLAEGTHDNVIRRNLISGNDYDGIGINGYNNVQYGAPPIQTYRNFVDSNIVGLDININPLPNTAHGVAVGMYGPIFWGCADRNIIGPDNIIATNLCAGVVVWEDPVNPFNADQNLITRNSIYNNGSLGIDLSHDGVTLNDLGDPDLRPNEEVNFPVISSAINSLAGALISGTISILGNPAQATVEVFKAALDPTGYGEGKTYLGSAIPDPLGNWNLIVPGLVIGDSITATTVDMNNNTSEFCLSVVITDKVVIDTCQYYKASYTDYAPAGMPDFDQKQNNWFVMNGLVQQWTHCGPVALANCFWWFDSKFETNTTPPPAIVDNYPLVKNFTATLIDDHDASNVIPFVDTLAKYALTNQGKTGTDVMQLAQGAQDWLDSVGLGSRYSVRVQPADPVFGFEWIRQQVLESQDVILLLGFWQEMDGIQCERIGGHYVTVAGTCPNLADSALCISDPYFDDNEAVQHASNIHNDAQFVSGPHGKNHHDRYNVDSLTCTLMNQYPYFLELSNYPINAANVLPFVGQNTFDLTLPGQNPIGSTIHTVIEWTIVICPVQEEVDTCDYYKPGYPDYSPNGIPDFDQKQNGWFSPTLPQQWTYDGPTALANCFWWFDSKYEPVPVPPPGISDNYPLVSDFTLLMGDDHSPNNVIPFIDSLALYSGCNPFSSGTFIGNLYNGAQAWLAKTGLVNQYCMSFIPVPDVGLIEGEVLKSKNVILLLGFYEPLITGQCNRLGGHFVTAAGACSTSTRICISDPYFDKNEGEPAVGFVHPSHIHNDAALISGPHGTNRHDYYTALQTQLPCFIVGGPQPLVELVDYPDNWGNISNFANLNPTIIPPQVTQYGGGPIFTMIDWAIVIGPDIDGDGVCDPNDNCPSKFNPLQEDWNADGIGDSCCCVDSTGNVDEQDIIDISDLSILVAYLTGGQVTSFCYGEANVDALGIVDISDLSVLIAFLTGQIAHLPVCP